MAVMKVGAAGIETISGALKRPKKQNGHSHGNYLCDDQPQLSACVLV